MSYQQHIKPKYTNLSIENYSNFNSSLGREREPESGFEVNYNYNQSELKVRDHLNLYNDDELSGSTYDDINTLIRKNTKLRRYLIESASSLIKLKKEHVELKDKNQTEKEAILNDLNRITDNYAIYSESHRNYQLVKEELDKVKSEFDVLQENLNHYKEFIKYFLILMIKVILYQIVFVLSRKYFTWPEIIRITHYMII